MTRDDIRLLYEYDGWANRRVLKAASELSDEQFTRTISGSFHCLRDTLLHILGGEWIWLAYWRNPPDSPASLSELKAKRDALFSPEAFPNLDALQSKWIEVESEQSEFISRLNNDSLAKMLPFRGTRLTLMQLMQHVVNHSSYHRGQVAFIMRQLGAKPLATDFHVFLLEHLGGSATAQVTGAPTR
jgi:uncharacterized damage-inducible protein DinB